MSIGCVVVLTVECLKALLVEKLPIYIHTAFIHVSGHGKVNKTKRLQSPDASWKSSEVTENLDKCIKSLVHF